MIDALPIAVVLAGVPSLAYLVVLNLVDRYEKEPWTILLACIGLGAVAMEAVYCAIALTSLFGLHLPEVPYYLTVCLLAFAPAYFAPTPLAVSRWLRIDLPHKIAGLGVPVTTVTAHAGRDATVSA